MSEGLPTLAGFYWWRPNPKAEWRMVQLVDYSIDQNDPSHLMSYDVEMNSWSGRSLKSWSGHFAIGEWKYVQKPPATQPTEPKEGM